jgi:hypothetical protein
VTSVVFLKNEKKREMSQKKGPFYHSSVLTQKQGREEGKKEGVESPFPKPKKENPKKEERAVENANKRQLCSYASSSLTLL